MSFAGLSCSDEVDESNLYVFTGEQATDYIASQPELSKYLVLLKKAKSGKKGSTINAIRHVAKAASIKSGEKVDVDVKED